MDDRQRQAVRRLRGFEDFNILLEYLKDQRHNLRDNCENALDDTRLRMFQGGAQCMTRLLRALEEER